MGLESFYIKIIPSKNSCLLFEHLYPIFKELKISKHKNGVYVFKKNIVIELFEENKYIREIILQGCFANYEESLNNMFLISEHLGRLNNIEIYHELGIHQCSLEKQAFMKSIIEIYDKKYSQFLNTFGHVRFHSSPNSDFYNKLKWHHAKMKLRHFLEVLKIKT